MKLDPKKILKDFPIFARKINGKTLTFLDNASTSQKPKQVINALINFYEKINSNIHRGIYFISEQATTEYENCRKEVADFIHAKSEKEIIFTKNCTEAINLAAYSFGEKIINKGDEIIVSALEHHANLVPWQELCKRKKAHLKIIPLKKDFSLDLAAYKKLLSKKTKLVATTAMSNVLGVITPLKKIIQMAKKSGAFTLVDGAQSVAHLPTDVQDLNCDFFAFSAHKMLGPTGVGVLYGKTALLEKMSPLFFGGDMIKKVEQYKSSFNEIPWKFEAGTPNIADVIAFREALRYLKKIGLSAIHRHEQDLLKYAKKVFSKYKEVQLFTPKDEKNCGGILSFSVKGIHPHDIAQVFDEFGICIRAGHHCAEPLIKRLHVPATARMSFYLYNTKKDIDLAEKALKKVLQIFLKN